MRSRLSLTSAATPFLLWKASASQAIRLSAATRRHRRSASKLIARRQPPRQKLKATIGKGAQHEMCLASNLVKEAAAHADSAAAADKALREIDHEKTTFTRREIESQRHDLVIIEDRIYDADRFQWAHPGGSLFVAMFGGRDGTLAFQSYHMRSFPHEKLRPYLRGRLAPGETITRFDQDHLELSKKLGGAAPYFAPTYQKYKAGFIWVLAFVLEAYALTVRRSWLLATCLGFLYAMIGLNIQHDANHGIESASFDLPRHAVDAVAAMAWRWPCGRLDGDEATRTPSTRRRRDAVVATTRESMRLVGAVSRRWRTGVVLMRWVRHRYPPVRY